VFSRTEGTQLTACAVLLGFYFAAVSYCVRPTYAAACCCSGCPGSPFVIVNVSDAALFHTREDLLEKELLSEAAGVDLVVDGFRLGNFMEVNADGSQVLRLHQHHFEELVVKFKRAAGDMDWRMFLSHNDRMGEVFTDGSKEGAALLLCAAETT
jgi:hypothetical protein